MASTSTTTFPISYSQSQSKFLNPLRQPRIQFHSRNKHTSISLQPATIRPTLLPLCTFSGIPTSRFRPQTSLPKFLSQKIASLLIGSFIFFMGCCLSKNTAFAVAAVPSVMEEKMEAMEGKSEEEEMYEKLLEKDSRNVEALKVIVYGKIRRGKCNEAVKFVESLIDLEPNEVEWKLLLALCYETMGELSKAKTLFREILEKMPLQVRALHGLAMVMHKNHEGPAVFEMLNKARELASNENRVTEERNIRILIAQMLVVQGNLEEGLKRFQDLIDENYRDFRPYFCQGIIYSLLDQKEEAARQFEIYQTLVPEEFPQRGFLDDIALTAQRTSREQFQKELGDQFSYRKWSCTTLCGEVMPVQISWQSMEQSRLIPWCPGGY
ncbi:protein SLOW GREEN 1, chloroplastic isoform X2 [Lotus japonicus]|uniref:protein SLOW GREEN 1, chloroplastic isoform X2 n=2 Tax=Lotus japonicus TaxID=34305 RepID=UPI00258964E5|nr:protein SLOW GREEN 1, chloroplastic isoform X2 [Lotus japonicus]